MDCTCPPCMNCKNKNILKKGCRFCTANGPSIGYRWSATCPIESHRARAPKIPLPFYSIVAALALIVGSIFAIPLF